jgi:hypothetical protein
MKHKEILSAIQADLNAPKGQTNKFGGYTYRSCEDILEALKPLLAEHRAAVTLTDELFTTDAHVYIKSTATLLTTDGDIHCEALAREAMDAKGMSPAQCTGAASSYARKYALNGLFCIDDNKDADATNTHGKEEKQNDPKKPRFAKVGSAESSKVIANTKPVNAGGDWKSFEVPFGKNKGTRLGELTERSLSWYIENIEADGRNQEFRRALDFAKNEVVQVTEKERSDSMTPNVVNKLPFSEGDDNELPF